MAQPRDRGFDHLSRLAPERRDQPLPEAQHVLHPDERGFDIDLGELRLPVGPEVLVPEAAGDLEVPVEARHHEQLLVELGRLRQREELAPVDPARHQVVARALGRGLGENRRLDLEKTQAVEIAPRRLHQPMPQDQGALQLGPAEVEHPMPQSKLLRRQIFLLLPRHRNRRGLRRTDDFESGDVDLDLPRDQAGIAGGLGPKLHGARGEDHRLRAQGGGALHDLGRSPLGVAGELHQPGAVAQIDEHQSAEIPPPVHPPTQADRAAEIGPGQCAGEIGAQHGGAGRAALDHGANALRRRRGGGRAHQGSSPRPAVDGRCPAAPAGRCDSGS